MLPERCVSLFRNGRNQALRIPREFELAAEKAIIRKEVRIPVKMNTDSGGM